MHKRSLHETNAQTQKTIGAKSEKKSEKIAKAAFSAISFCHVKTFVKFFLFF